MVVMHFNAGPVVRMTASLAEKMFRTAPQITAADLTEQHLDMLQMIDIDIQTRADLGDASDCLAAGDRGAVVVQRCVAAFNARAGR